MCGSIQFHKNCKLKPSLIWKDIGFAPCRSWIRFCMSGWTTTKIKQGLEILTGGFSHQAVMRTQMSLLLSTSCRRQPWIITYLPTESVFNTQQCDRLQFSNIFGFELRKIRFCHNFWWTHIIWVTQKEWRKLWKGLFLKLASIETLLG